MLKNSNSAQYIYIKTKILPKIFWQDFLAGNQIKLSVSLNRYKL
ncbi:hypothetical protein HMPREF9393_0745 [Streptococcus sanguinis SK1056]|uniref:Uncharacterized protein n=1 Tax=Streptococcus sanguinis SK1056 TaxID=888820 RepID=F3UB22_STRSA|nr:hypothetical protein HMPREF9393_0745 [Streptococcus sanguinis SK1056]